MYIYIYVCVCCHVTSRHVISCCALGLWKDGCMTSGPISDLWQPKAVQKINCNGPPQNRVGAVRWWDQWPLSAAGVLYCLQELFRFCKCKANISNVEITEWFPHIKYYKCGADPQVSNMLEGGSQMSKVLKVEGHLYHPTVLPELPNPLRKKYWWPAHSLKTSWLIMTVQSHVHSYSSISSMFNHSCWFAYPLGNKTAQWKIH